MYIGKSLLSTCIIVHNVRRSQALSYSTEDDVFRTSRSRVRGTGECEKHHPRPSTCLALSCVRYFIQGKDVFYVFLGVWYNIRKLGNIWGGDFYCTWTVKPMNCACASACKVCFTVQVR